MSSKLVHTTYVCTLLPSCILIIQYIMHLTKSIVTLPDSLIAIYKRSEQSVEFLNLCWCFSQEIVCIFSNQSFAFKVVQLHFGELNISLQPWMLSINSILWLRKSSRFPKCNLVYFKRMYSGIRLKNYKAKQQKENRQFVWKNWGSELGYKLHNSSFQFYGFVVLYKILLQNWSYN